MFLTRSELTTGILPAVINIITAFDPRIVDDIIKESIATMVAYLANYYDTDTIFEAVDDDRDLFLLKHLKAIVIHNLYSRRSVVFNEVAKANHDEAITWLEKVGSGKLGANLPYKTVDEDGDGNPDGIKSSFIGRSGKQYQTGW